jgi:hypothetical protein
MLLRRAWCCGLCAYNLALTEYVNGESADAG